MNVHCLRLQPWGGRMKIISAIMLALVMAGCATTEQFETNLNSLVGQPETVLISQWGPPQNFYETGGVKFLSWSNQRNIPIAGTAPTYNRSCVGTNCTTISYGGSPGYNLNMHCTVVMTVQNGKVTNWRYQGNDCKARP